MTFSRTTAAIAAVVLTFGLTACSSSGSVNETPTTAVSSEAEPANTDLATLVPPPAGATETKGPHQIDNGGIHLYYQVDGSPKDVMTAFRDALAEHGWEMTTITSGGGDHGGGATYTGTHGDAYGVFDGGGFQTTTHVDVCVWPTKPADPDCDRDDE